MTCAAFGHRRLCHLDHIQVGVVGGRNRSTGKYQFTLTDAQRNSLDLLYQTIVNTLNIPLEIDERLSEGAFDDALAEEQRLELEDERYDAMEELTLHA